MENRIAVRQYVDDLFAYIEAYENDYAKFQAEAFIQTFQGTCAVFQALRQQRDQAVELDRVLLDRIKQAPLTSSDLRHLTIQILVSFFEAEADIDGLSNKAFTYCRGLRAVKQDVPYFEGTLAPLLFCENALHGNFRLNAFMLQELSRYLNSYGRPIDRSLSPEAFGGFTIDRQFLELQRRRLTLGSDVLSDRGSLEFHLSRVETFGKLAEQVPLAQKYLKNWAYLSESSLWSRIKKALSETGGKGRGAFSSWRYFRLVLTQRNPAYLWYGTLIVLFIFLAIWVPRMWADYEQEQLQQMEQRVEQRPITSADASD